MSETNTLELPTQQIVTLTPAAVKQVKRLIEKRGDASLGLRIGVKGGGCSGLSYLMGLEAAPRETDVVYYADGVQVMIDSKSARFVQGVILDYSLANLLEGGWKWTNPNAAKSCGCGTSFTPKV